MDYSVAIRTYWHKIFYRVNPIVFVHLGERFPMMYVDKPFYFTPILFAKIKVANLTDRSVVPETVGACTFVSLILVYCHPP